MPSGRFRSTLVAAAAMTIIAGCAAGGTSSKPTVAAPENIAGVVIERVTGHNHRAGKIDYPGPKPPSGGDHAAVWLNCGFYSTPQPDENAVHSLEHGAAWIAYSPATSATDIATLRRLAARPYVVVTPHDGLASPFVLVAWERRLDVDSIDDPRVGLFLDTYTRGATAPESGAACSGGVGSPG